MKINITLTILLLLALSIQGWSQHTAIRGQILDAQTKERIAGAVVSIEQMQLHAISDAQGNFTLVDVPAGVYKLTTFLTGYKTIVLDIKVTTNADINLVQLLESTVVELEEISVSAEPELQAKVISDVDIHLRSAQTSQDILRMVPGLFIAQHAGGGKAEQIFLRGFDIDHGTDIEVTTDGIPVNMVSHAHGQGYADLHFLIPETVDRVHFGKGPYHMHHGNMATAGFVGFQTFNTLEENTLSFQVGQFNSYRGLGMINLLNSTSDDGFQHAYIAVEYNTTDGYFDSPQDFHRLNLFGKCNGSLGKNNSISISGSTFSSAWNASGQIPVRAVDNGSIGYFGAIDDTEGGMTSRSNVNIRLTTSLHKNGFIKNQVYYSKYHFDLYSNFTFFLKDPVLGDQIRQKENRNLSGYRGAYTRSDEWFGIPITSEVGLHFRHDLSKDNELSHTVERSMIVERMSFGDITESNLGAYLNETVYVTERLTVNTGLRFDHFEFEYVDHLLNDVEKKVSDNILSPKLNAYYKLTNQLQLSANMGYGFHSNDTRVVVQQEAFETLPRALGMDAGILWKPVPKILISASLWHLNLDQEFVYVGDEAIVELSGRTERKGIEFAGRMEITGWMYADVDFNYTLARSVEEPDGQDYIPLAPKFSSIGGLTVMTNKHWSGSVRFRHLGDRAANEDNTVVAAGYTVVDLLINYRVKKYEFGLTIDNLFDTRWREAQFNTESRLRDESIPVPEIHFTPGTPFNLRVHIAYKF